LERPPVLDHWSYGLLVTFLFLWLAYVAGHTLYNIYDPYRPQDFAMKNLMKTVLLWTGPLALIWYFARNPAAIVVPKNFPITLARIFCIALSINILFRLFEFLLPEATVIGDPLDNPENPQMLIPVVNVMPAAYALRATTPAIALFCAAFLLARSQGRQFGKKRKWFFFGLVLASLGAILSGGRATVAFVFVLVAFLMLVRGRIGALLGCLGAFVIMIGTINAFPDLYEASPGVVRRSLNWAYFGGSRAQTSEMIRASTDWRQRLFFRALDEWRSDDRIFWFGRATYKYGVGDWFAMKLQGEEGNLESSLRRGATHNMITDLLVIFGLIGFVLYTLLNVALFYFLWVVYRSSQVDEIARTLALVILVSLGFLFVYGLIGGATFPITMAWLLILLFSYLYRSHAQTLAATEDAKTGVPAIGRRFVEGPRTPRPFIAH
jgi:hypothetical protein